MATSRRPAPFNEHTWAQASDWLLRFSEEEGDAVAREQFNDWLRRSPENVHAYLQVSAFWQSADQLGRGDDGPRDIDALVARAKTGGNVLSLANLHFENGSQSRTEVQRPRHPPVSDTATKSSAIKRRFALAASIFVAMGGLSAYYHLQRGVYQTDVGEQRIVNLPDGSTMTLNADSRVTVRYTDTARTIDLDGGQALFKVARNATRPFVVKAGGTRVRAVGTQFDVYRKRSGTVVTVVEGRVAVSSLATRRVATTAAASSTAKIPGDVLLSAGQQLTVAAVAARVNRSIEIEAPPPPVVHLVKLETATAWTEGLLVFDSAPLDEVVQEFNRQNAKPLIVEGGGLAAVRITGAFPASGSERLTRFLQERHGVMVDETDDAIRISRR